MKESNTMWLCNKLFNLCSTIVSYVSSFFTATVISKTSEFIPKNSTLDEQIMALLAKHLEKAAALQKPIEVTPFDSDRMFKILEGLVESHVQQGEQIELIKEALLLLGRHQDSIKRHVINSFETMSPVLLDTRQLLMAIQSELATKTHVDLQPIGALLKQVIINQSVLNTEFMAGFPLTDEGLTRIEGGLATNVASIIQNYATLQTNIQDQALSGGNPLGTLISGVGDNVLPTPSGTTGHVVEFLTANLELTSVVTNALI